MRTPPTNVLDNPYFAGGSSASWELQVAGPPPTVTTYGQWVVATGGPLGSGYGAAFNGPGTAAVRNTTHIACVAGGVVKGQCYAYREGGATGYGGIRIGFYDANDVLLAAL